TSLYFDGDPTNPAIGPLMLGRTPFTIDRNRGLIIDEVDVDHDGVMDHVYHFDPAALIRNGDLRVGQREIVLTGTVSAPGYGKVGLSPLRSTAAIEVRP